MIASRNTKHEEEEGTQAEASTANLSNRAYGNVTLCIHSSTIRGFGYILNVLLQTQYDSILQHQSFDINEKFTCP